MLIRSDALAPAGPATTASPTLVVGARSRVPVSRPARRGRIEQGMSHYRPARWELEPTRATAIGLCHEVHSLRCTGMLSELFSRRRTSTLVCPSFTTFQGNGKVSERTVTVRGPVATNGNSKRPWLSVRTA